VGGDCIANWKLEISNLKFLFYNSPYPLSPGFWGPFSFIQGGYPPMSMDITIFKVNFT
jgi:hypothetical protein